MRCDLHVHTVHSGFCTVPGLTRICAESFNEPLALYERLKQRGMELVTASDHDSIDAVEELRRGTRGHRSGSGRMILSQARTTLSAPDYKLMRRVNHWRAPRWVRWWMLLATRAGDGWLWGAVGIALLCSSDAVRFRAFEAAGCAVAAGIAIFHSIKQRVCRPRPRDLEPHCWAYIATKDRFSFPSGHSTTAFAVAMSLGSFYPEIMPVLLMLAANVAISRVIVGMHFLSDVLAGASVGALLGYVAFRFAV